MWLTQFFPYPIYDKLLQSGYEVCLQNEKAEEVTRIVLYTLGSYGIQAVSFEEPIVNTIKSIKYCLLDTFGIHTAPFLKRRRLLENVQTQIELCHEVRGKKQDQTRLKEWLREKNAVTSLVKPEQEIQWVKWLAVSFCRFPFQKNLGTKYEKIGIEHEKNQIEGMSCLYRFTEGQRDLTSEQKCLIQRVLWIHRYWQFLVDWTQDNVSRESIKNDLLVLYAPMYPNFSSPPPNKAEHQFAFQAATFKTYMIERVLRNLSFSWNLTFSEDAKQKLLTTMQDPHAFLDITYFVGKQKFDRLPNNRPASAILQSFALFFHFSQECKTKEDRTYLFDLALSCNHTLGENGIYQELLNKAKSANLEDVSQALSMTSKYAPSFLCSSKDKGIHFYLFLFFLIHCRFDFPNEFVFEDLYIHEFLLLFGNRKRDDRLKAYCNWLRLRPEASEKKHFYTNMSQIGDFTESQLAFLDCIIVETSVFAAYLHLEQYSKIKKGLYQFKRNNNFFHYLITRLSPSESESERLCLELFPEGINRLVLQSHSNLQDWGQN